MSPRRSAFATALALVALTLAACAGLPTSGGVNPGLPAGEVESGTDTTFFPAGPVVGASPETIVEGFIGAATSPAGGWAIAKQFFATPEDADAWRPEASVTLDRSWTAREVTATINETRGQASVQIVLTPVATVDSAGTYRLSTGSPAEVPPYELVRTAEGEWRLVSAPDGIVMDAESFSQVFRRYAIQYFDQQWQHLVPDPRWFPRRDGIETVIARAVIDGAASTWLADAVTTAFPASISLGRESVPVSPLDHVAEVELTAGALSLDATTLARMRTQLEESLKGTDVSGVRFTVEGRPLEAGLVEIAPNRIDTTTFVLAEAGFGAVVGEEVVPVPGVSEVLAELESPVRAIDLAGDAQSAAVLTDEGVYRVGTLGALLIDERADLLAPGIDAHDFIWSVPRTAPHELLIFTRAGEPVPLEGAWPEATAISQLRLSPDGVRLAAVVTLGGREWLTFVAVIRDAQGTPVSLGPAENIMRLPGESRGVAWLGDNAVGVLTRDGDTQQLIELTVGGPAAVSVVPTETMGMAGANTASGVRLLSSTGVVSVKEGTTWQEFMTEVLVLGTQSGR